MTLFQFDKILEWIPFISKGLGVTLLIALIAAVFGFVIGVIIVVFYNNKSTRWISKIYVDIFRGTPLLLQLSMIYFAVPQLVTRIFNGLLGFDFDITMTQLLAAGITFSMNSGAYISEIIRSGINSVDPGEIEAAKALGVSPYNTFMDIILPTAFKNSFPALMNEFTTLIKESSIVSIIGVQDLMRRQQIVTSQTYMYFEPLIVVGIIYYLVIKMITMVSRKLEKEMSHDRSQKRPQTL